MRKRNHLLAYASLLFLLLLLTGCVLSNARESEEEIVVYRISLSESEGKNQVLVQESVPGKDGETPLDTAVSALNNEPESTRMKRAFPENVTLLDCSVDQEGRAVCEMSEAYADLSGVSRSLADWALTYTLYRFDTVLSVDIYCQGEAVSTGLRAVDAELSDSELCGCERILKLFLPSEDGQSLRVRSFCYTDDGSLSMEEVCVQALLTALDQLPDSTRLLSVTKQDTFCMVNLSEELYTTEPDNPVISRCVINAFVESLTSLPSVERIRLDVSGVPMSSYGSYQTRWPAEHDPSFPLNLSS